VLEELGFCGCECVHTLVRVYVCSEASEHNIF